MREARNALDPLEATHTSRAAVTHLVRCDEFRHARHIAGYVAVGNEADPVAALITAHDEGKCVYLPRIRPHRQLLFAQWQPDLPLHKHPRLGIPEPSADAPTIHPEQLDLVIVPLVGFDAAGHRLGMGGGFYDKTFAFRQDRPAAKPILVGFAHAIQICNFISPEAWDTPLDLVVTEKGLQRFPTRYNDTPTV